MAVSVKLPLALDVELSLHWPTESAPEIHVWLSQTVSKDWFSVKVQKGARAGRLAFDFVCEVQPHDLPNLGNADLNLELYAVTANHHDESCLTQEGGTILPLASLVSAFEQGKGVGRPFLFPQLEIRERNIVKCTAVVSLTQAPTIDGVPLQKFLAQRRIKLEAYSDSSRLERWVDEYIENTVHIFGPLGTKSTFSALKRVNAFEYRSRVELLPAAAYVDVPESGTPEEFFYNAAKLALAGRGFSEREALLWDVAGVKEHADQATYWLADTLSLVCQYCYYRTDQVVDPATGRATEVEWFQYPQCSDGSGDCEDFSSVPLILSRDLDQIAAPRNELVGLLKRIKSAFYVVMLLDGVSSDEVANASAALPDHMSAHMNSALVNRFHMNSWLDKDTKPRPHVPSRYVLPMDVVRRFVSIAMMEGTGVLESDGHFKQDPRAEARLNSAFGGAYDNLTHAIRRTYYYSAGADGKVKTDFYRAVKLLLTPEISDTQFIWVIEARATHTAGALFSDIVSGSPGLVARAQPAFSEKQLFDMRFAKRNTHPVPPLQPPLHTTESEEVRAARAAIDTIIRRLAELPGYASAEPPRTARYSRILVKNRHMARKQWADEFGRALSAAVLKHNLVYVGVLEQQVTPTLGGFRLHLFWGQ
jgi:hypothetical protein